MPPRLRASRFSSAVVARSPTQPQSTSQPARVSREFSQTSCQQTTLRRRKFYEWLNGPGSALREPIPGSTNYLGAYDRYGNLVRAGPGWSRKSPTEPEPEKQLDEETSVNEPSPEKSGEEKLEGQETIDELEMSVRREEESKKKTKTDESDKLPPETAQDLQPFPLNKWFRSQPVLSEELREAIYQRVHKGGATVSLASVEFGVSNERVGAVVRLKQMEKEWIAQGKTLALPYARAVLGMLPTTPHVDTSRPGNRSKRPITHEAINDLIVHPATRQQLFVPVAESRKFTREDAGKAFDNQLLPADARIPHPELIQAERELASGLSFEERKRLATERIAQEQAKKTKEEEARQADLRAQKRVPQRRWDFVFKDVSVDSVGRNGRDPRGVGWRYGFPHEDRKKGQVKIPTKVEA
ncbi:eukaryotic mitochondrial regulator protein-domain-containing protein [Massariosphaeria phaeospora]|uniref:Eukaryotic mitochondrial regulator protein-domain-containing protein n=1 Tax=Massariosphaeria phaeospora TaxID=100035 RepID=A0A7C8I0F3_9PLEO|nr:eukaryotic mitochondrial regulator protein-domain-containing protein [Massariosphaeria phaeospora]